MEKLSEAIEALKTEKRQLEEEKADIAEKRRRLEEDSSVIYGNTKPSDVIHLNVGGKRIDVLRRTLCYVEGSMLASKFSGRWDDSLEKDKDGNFFINQDFDCLYKLIKFLRDKEIESPKYPVSSPEGDEDFYRLLEYYGMMDAVYPTLLVPIYVPEDDAFCITNGKAINASEWCTFDLTRQHHSRKIESVEVQLGDVQRLQIGLQVVDKNKCILGTYKFNYSQSEGVGNLKDTYSIDPLRSCALIQGAKLAIDNVDIKEGTVIKVELSGNYYVDGKLIASVDGKDGSHKIGMYIQTYNDCVVPAISIKGSAKIININYYLWND